MRGRRPPSAIRPAQPLIQAPKPSIRPTDPIEIRGVAGAKIQGTAAPAPTTFRPHTPRPVVAKPTALSQPEIPTGAKNAELRGRLAQLTERNGQLEDALQQLVEAVLGHDTPTIQNACALAIGLIGAKEIGCSNPKK